MAPFPRENHCCKEFGEIKLKIQSFNFLFSVDHMPGCVVDILDLLLYFLEK